MDTNRGILFFGISIQPTEIAKFATNLAVAKLLSEIQIDLRKIKSLIQVFLIILIPVILTLLQPDFGSALIFLSFIFVLFREGLNPNFVFFSSHIFSIGLIFPN